MARLRTVRGVFQTRRGVCSCLTGILTVRRSASRQPRDTPFTSPCHHHTCSSRLNRHTSPHNSLLFNGEVGYQSIIHNVASLDRLDYVRCCRRHPGRTGHAWGNRVHRRDGCSRKWHARCVNYIEVIHIYHPYVQTWNLVPYSACRVLPCRTPCLPWR